MIRVVRGQLEAVEEDRVLVCVGPVSLEIGVPASAIPSLGPVGSQVCLYTYLTVRDERPVLYGFPSEEGRRLFALLLTVSGIGPRLAMSLLGHLRPQEISVAIAKGDAETLAKAPGIGRKTASRIVLELKGQVEKALEGVPESQPTQRDLLSALLALGYSHREAQEAVKAVSADSSVPLEERLRLALHYLGEGRSR